MTVNDLSPSTQDYLKCVWNLQEWTGEAVSVTALAERLGVRTSTASDGVKKLTRDGLLDHAHYGSVTLTESGRAHALAMVRRHRLLETFLVNELGYDWDEVHDEAEVLEHAVSDRLMNAIDRRLGFPTRDPHGDPIPSPDGAQELPDAVRLSEAGVGPAIVTRVSDDDPEHLRTFAEAGVVPDAAITIDAVADAVVLRSPNGPVTLPRELAELVWITTHW